MSAITHFEDILQVLDAHPEWREELRRRVLTEELLSLPDTVGALAQHQGQLAARMDQLAERMDQLTERVDQLTERMHQLIERMDQLAERHVTLSNDVGWLKGTVLEMRYRDHAGAYFGSILRRVHALTNDELVALADDAADAGRISDGDSRNLLDTDLVLRGRCKETGTEAYLAVEVSWGVGPTDVQRAYERAELLRKMGKTVFPVVAGTWVTPDGEELAKAYKVWKVTNGKATAPRSV